MMDIDLTESTVDYGAGDKEQQVPERMFDWDDADCRPAAWRAFGED